MQFDDFIKINPFMFGALFFIIFDIFTGIVKTFKNKNFSSAEAKKGLFNKSGFIMIMFLSMACEYFENFIDLGFNIPLTTATCTMIIYTEFISIMENIADISPTLKNYITNFIQSK